MARGTEAVALVKKQASKGEDLTFAGTEYVLPLLSESMQAAPTIYQSQALRKRALANRKLARLGTLDVSGNMELEATNFALHDLMPLIFPDVAQTALAGADDYSTTYKVNTDDELDYFSLAISDGDIARIYRDCRVNSFGIQADINQLARMTLDIPGIRIATQASTIAGTMPGNEYGLYFEQATVQLGDAGGVLAEVPASSFSFNLNRGLNTNRYQLGSRSRRNLPGGLMEMSGSVSLDANPISTDKTMLYDAVLNAEWLALKLQFIDPTNKVVTALGVDGVEGGGDDTTEDSKFIIDLPYCLIEWPQHNISGPDFIEGAVNFTVFDDDTSAPNIVHQYSL